MMRRALFVGILCLLPSAQAAYCFETPEAEGSLFPVFQGQPKKVVEVSTFFPDVGPQRDATRTFLLDRGQITQVLWNTNRGTTQAAASFQSRTGSAWQGSFQRESDSIMAAFSGQSSVTLTSVLASPKTPLTLTFDGRNRLSSYTGVELDDLIDENLPPVKIQVSCTYSLQKREVYERTTLAGAIAIARTARFDELNRLMAVEISQKLKGSAVPATVLKTTYAYGPDGHLNQSEQKRGETVVLTSTFATDSGGRVLRFGIRTTDGYEMLWTSMYDTQGNLTSQRETMNGRLTRTVIRTITY
ncbi:hypothetical protein GO986_00165 [Deinococcus sp. HMF7620]|uniref:Uncharacterized protein n=1 Tax=Deinococcus arboris TaxID=2682977 RepID=A0A7C9M5L5_9DEIO|nr:hypothetical protein [Deinococcus arboris]MVN85183.1 hypothetical protein [Deinococcus arboris]